MTENIWVVEWSKKHNALHKHELSLALEKNFSAFIGDVQMDYIQMFQGSKEECEALIGRIREKLVQRDKFPTIKSNNRRNYHGK